MLLPQFGHVKSALKYLTVLFTLLSLTACIPSMQRVYHAPAVNGNVIDLATMQPLQGAVVVHLLDDNSESKASKKDGSKAIVTNVTGEFHLPSESSFDFTLLMAGHAIKYYPVRISTEHTSAVALAQASMKMLSEETTYINTAILDPSPTVIAATPPGDYLSHQQLLSYLDPQAEFGYCDLKLGSDALSLMNTARKLYWRAASKATDGTQVTNSDFDHQNVALAYSNAKSLWQYFYHSCRYGESGTLAYKKALMAVSEISTKIYKEIDTLSNKP